jgi:hypothetical protein
MVKLPKKFLFPLAGLGLCSALLFAGEAKAQTVPQEVTDAVATVNAVATMLLGVVKNFTTVMITPMGISAAAKMFKHVVLANV